MIKSYPDKKVHYSNQYYTHLKGLCEKYGYNVSDESIFNELENALTYSDNWTGLKKEQREFLNEKAKNVIKDVKKKFKWNLKCQEGEFHIVANRKTHFEPLIPRSSV